MCEDDDEFITGPCNTVNYILKQFDCDEVAELVKKMKSLEIFNKKNPFYLKVSDEEDDSRIFTGPRVGLSNKYPEFMVKEYRYLKQPSKIVKCRSSILSSLHNSGIKETDICKITKVSKATVQKAIKEFDDAEEFSEEEVKQLKPDKINQIFGYYSKQ